MQSTSDQPITSLPATHERSKDMCPSRSCLALLLGLMFLAGLAGCGPASSDNAPNFESRASVDGPEYRPEARGTGRGEKIIPLIASGNETVSTSGRGAARGGESLLAAALTSSNPAYLGDPLVVPVWMAKELDSPDARVRLRALETWVQSAPTGAVDRLILALEDKDERVRARAMELVEQVWARMPEAEK
jgi:hypothetical protein